MRNRSLSPATREPTNSKEKRSSLSRQRTRRPMSSNTDHEAYDKLLKTTYIMSSIRKSIKENDLKYLVGERREKLRTEPSGDPQWAEKATHDTLIDIRRRYDAVKRERILKLQHTQKLKERVKTYSYEQEQWSSKIVNGRKYSKASETFMGDNQQDLEFKMMDKQVYEFMCYRLREDISYYKAKIVISKRKLRESNNYLKSQGLEYKRVCVEKENASILLKKLAQTLQAEEKDRLEHVSDLEAMMQDKLLKQRSELERIEYEEEEAQKALLAKNEEEHSWNFLLLTHLMVKKILLNKMEKEMEKFKAVEQAFKAIKSKTEVKDAATFVDRFLNKDRNYGELLSEVTKTKDRFNRLKEEEARLLRENKRLEEASQDMLNVQYVRETEKTAKRITDKAMDGLPDWPTDSTVDLVTLKKRLTEWLLRQLIKFQRMDARRYPFSYNEGIKELFLRYLEYLNDISQRESVGGDIWEDPSNNLSAIEIVDLDQVGLENKSFISTHIKSKFQPKPDRIDMKNSSKLFQTDKPQQKQPEQQTYKTEQELTTIEAQRQDVIQSNYKFMRELRTRHRLRKL